MMIMGTSFRPLAWRGLLLLVAGLISPSSSSKVVQSWDSSFCETHVIPKGYDCEEHKLYSDDGYMLLLHRTGVRSHLPIRNPVLLMHHEMQSGESWFQSVKMGNDTLLPFILVDRGFDVWVGHERATLWSHDHLQLSVDDDAYWNFTWDEHVRFDIPKMLSYIGGVTNATVHYVGISLSAAAGTAAASDPSVAPLLRSLTLIAPAIYRGGLTPLWLQILMQSFTQRAGTNQPPEHHQGAFSLARELHIDAFPLTGPASHLRFLISGPDCCLGPSAIPLDNGWDGVTSYKNIMHIGQAILTNTFQHFDYGSAVANAAAYNGSTIPPQYKPSDIPADLPMLIVYGGRDFFTPPEGILQFMTLTQSQPKSVYLPSYAHLDMFLSLDRAEYVYGPIQCFLREECSAPHPFSS